ncbi:MFS transporter [Mucilaginibacter sp. HMF5004]|uniref:MFS transporter n=1 Tax=Mucilaginibacter rivuli TaxID=2857527 RepID=UPI001C5D24F2|nr:MFS transporter [Mucilaginibacter rivuli]MBW4891715.1 MFS transporter [Mucilaginibacter rivuli]
MEQKHPGMATAIAFALIPLSGFATDIYLPSLPAMAGDLHVSGVSIQLTLSLFLISYGVSQLFLGSFLDSYGRYKAGLAALLIFVVASLVIATSTNLYLICGMRVVHGFAVGLIMVGKRAYFVDVFTGEKLKHYLSMLSIIWSAGPIVAPFFGGYLQKAFGWQSNFYFLAGLAFIILVLEYMYGGETLPVRTPFKLKRVVLLYKKMLTTASFTLGIVMLGTAYGMVMIYNMTGPFIIQHHLNLSPVVTGYSSLFLGFAWMTGGFIGKATIKHSFYKRLLVNLFIQFVFIAVMLVSLQFVSNIYSLLFFAFIIHVSAGFTFNNYFAFCLGKFPKNAGIAGGLTGGLNYVIISFLSYGVVNLFPARDERNLSYSYLLLILISAVVMFAVSRFKDKEEVLSPN